MPTTNSYRLSRAQWLVDWENSPRDLGAQINWESVNPPRVDAAGKRYVPDRDNHGAHCVQREAHPAAGCGRARQRAGDEKPPWASSSGRPTRGTRATR